MGLVVRWTPGSVDLRPSSLAPVTLIGQEHRNPARGWNRMLVVPIPVVLKLLRLSDFVVAVVVSATSFAKASFCFFDSRIKDGLHWLSSVLDD